MPLKFKVTKKDDVPAEHASLYVEKDGVFVLDVEGAVAREKLEEFRTNNINLQNQIKAFEGIDVEKAKELLQKQKELEDANLIKSLSLDEWVEELRSEASHLFEAKVQLLVRSAGLIRSKEPFQPLATQF